ncbi:hypothetical protein E3N88_13399 [Mikania micrantha]|uniref:Uncharacterized protein n=1 Tax=Mikania micrantha TaxID=192012 RepID=A0A5N6P8D5_9ASTR|nr:hypothetical protein E3N88_13399 [Mikania micrantha]
MLPRSEGPIQNISAKLFPFQIQKSLNLLKVKKVLIAEGNDGPVRNKATWVHHFNVALYKCKTFPFQIQKPLNLLKVKKVTEPDLYGCYNLHHLDLIELHEDSCGSQPSIALPPLSQLELVKLHEDSCVSQPSSNTVAMVKEAKGNSLCAIIGGTYKIQGIGAPFILDEVLMAFLMTSEEPVETTYGDLQFQPEIRVYLRFLGRRRYAVPPEILPPKFGTHKIQGIGACFILAEVLMLQMALGVCYLYTFDIWNYTGSVDVFSYLRSLCVGHWVYTKSMSITGIEDLWHRTIPCPPAFLPPATDKDAPTPNPNYTTWLSNDAHIRSLLISTISEASFHHVHGDTSRAIWLSLENAYAPTSFSRVSTLKTQLLRISMQANINHAIPESDLVMLVITGLREEFNSLKSTLLTRQTPTPFADLYGLLADHNFMIKKPSSDLPPAQAFTASSSSHPPASASSPASSDTLHALQHLLTQLQTSSISNQSPQAYYTNRSTRVRGGRRGGRGASTNNHLRSTGVNRSQFSWASNQNVVYGSCNRCGIGHLPSQCPNRDPSNIRPRLIYNACVDAAGPGECDTNFMSVDKCQTFLFQIQKALDLLKVKKVSLDEMHQLAHALSFGSFNYLITLFWLPLLELTLRYGLRQTHMMDLIAQKNKQR